jgi:hypothetical protein
MKNTLIVFCLSLGLVTPCLSAPERFLTDKPSPLKLAKPGKEYDRIVHFTGSARLSGQFFVGWETINKKPYYLRVVFFPDKDSSALLPHPADAGPVKELILSNSDQAVLELLEDSTIAQRILARDQINATGEATVIIRDYRTDVECDHRWYSAALVSVSKKQQIVAGTGESGNFGC